MSEENKCPVVKWSNDAIADVSICTYAAAGRSRWLPYRWHTHWTRFRQGTSPTVVGGNEKQRTEAVITTAFIHQQVAEKHWNKNINTKVAHTRLPSAGFRSWSRFLAVSLQVTWVINPCAMDFPLNIFIHAIIMYWILLYIVSHFVCHQRTIHSKLKVIKNKTEPDFSLW